LASWGYCGKEETRVVDPDICTGPLSHGLPPAKRNKAGDTKAKNKMILEYGLKKAIDEGLVPIEKAAQAQKSINLYHGLSNPSANSTLLNEWHVGPTGVGKSRPIREKHDPKDLYLKGCNIWWDHYTQQDYVLIEDLGHKMLGPQYLKVWGDHYPFTAEGKGYVLPSIRPKTIYVTSNWTIRELYPEPQDYEPLERRFKVHTYPSL